MEPVGGVVSLPAWQDAIIARGELYRVGGVLRDQLLGLPNPIDTDFVARGLPPDELEAILSGLGRLAFVGRAFGVYKFTPRGGGDTVDIAFPRVEVSTGPGHRDFDVRGDWTLPIETDLARRDFTINAIAERVGDGRRVDPFHGEQDLADRVLRTLFPRAFEEDPLRILRGARFAARFSLVADNDTLARMRAAAPLCATLSGERVFEESLKMMAQCRHPSVALDLLHRVGALAVLYPEIERCHGVVQNEYHPDDVYWHSLKACDEAPRDRAVVGWAALLHDAGKVDTRQLVEDDRGRRVVFYGHELVSERLANEVMTRLRAPAAFAARCRHLVLHHMFHYEREWRDSTLRRFMRTVGVEYLEDLFALREADCRSRLQAPGMQDELDALADLRARCRAEIERNAALSIADLAVDGADVMQELGIEAGPAVGEALHRLLERVIEHPSENQRDQLLEALRNGLKFGDDGKPGGE